MVLSLLLMNIIVRAQQNPWKQPTQKTSNKVHQINYMVTKQSTEHKHICL